MAATPFDRLAQVEMQIVMQHCDKVTLLRLARCSRATLAAALQPFAWRSLPPLQLQCKSPLQMSSRVSSSLLRHADLSVRWSIRLQADTTDGGGAKGHSASKARQLEQRQWVRAATEAEAVASLPRLLSLEVQARPRDVSRLSVALLDAGCALLTRLHVRLVYDEGGGGGRPDYLLLGRFVKRSHTLTALEVQDKYWDPDSIRPLADGVRQSQSLATLHIIDSFVRYEGAVALGAAVTHCRTLTELHFRGCEIDDAGAEVLVAALEQGTASVRFLNLSRNRFGAAGLTAVARLLASDRCLIGSLDLSFCIIGDEGAKSLALSLHTNRTLTQLQLDYCGIRSEGAAALAEALQTNRHMPLRVLVLSGNRVDAAGAAALAEFLRINRTLEELDLGDCEMDSSAVAALAVGLPAAGSLRQLSLGQSIFGVEGSTALLDVSHNRSFGDGGMAALAPALTRLRSLDLDACYCALTSASAASLALLLQPGCNLRAISLNDNAIGSTVVVALAAALQLSSPLRSLYLNGCGVDAQAATALSQALLRGWSGTELDIGGNEQLGDVGARALAATLEQRASRCSLQKLHLSGCSLTLAGALPLVRAATAVPSLRLLLLSNNAIGAADEPALIAARRNGPHFRLQLSM